MHSEGARNGVAAEPPVRFARRMQAYAPFGLVVLAVALGIGLPTWWLDGSVQRANAYTIATVAELKATAFDAWFAQRLASAGQLATYASLGDMYVTLREHGDLAAQDALRTLLQQFAVGNGFTSITVLDEHGVVLSTADDPAGDDLLLAYRGAGADGVRADGPRVPAIQAYRDDRGRVHVDVLTTLAVPLGTPTPRVVCHTASSDVFPLHASVWITPEYTGRVVLFRRTGDVIDGLAYAGAAPRDTPAAWQLPSDDDTRIAVLLTGGQSEPLSVTEGLDERGERVLGAGRAIEGSDWFVLAQVPREHAMAGAHRLRWSAGALAAATLGASVFGLGWGRQRRRFDTLDQVRRSQAERLHTLQLLQNLAASSTDAIFTKDRDGRYTLFNDAAGRFVGRPAAAVLGLDDTALFPPDEAARIREHDQRAIVEERVVSVEETLSTALGERAFLSTRGPLRDATGAVIGVFGISRDVTERSRAEAESRAHRLALQRTVEELERFNRVMVGREVAMIALKRHVNALATRLGEPAPYPDAEQLGDALSTVEGTDA